MSNDRDALRLFEHGEELGPQAPLVYLAMPLSHLTGSEDREHVELLAHTVGRAILDETRDAAEPWPVRIHSPAKWSAPWKHDDLSPDDVYRLNSEQLWEQADALIVIGFRGGSLGSGQELAWACSLHLPVLYVLPTGATVSRQLHGAASEHDITVSEYASPDHLADLVAQWLASRRHVIADGPRRRRGRVLRFTELQVRLRDAWAQLDAGERAHVVATTRMAEGRIERLLASAPALAHASLHEASELAAALRVDATSGLLARPLPDLRPEQTSALLNAAAEFGWDPEDTFELYTAARVEVARGGVRRLPLANPHDWAAFRRRLQDGH